MGNKDLINRYILEGVKNGKLDKEMSLLILSEINQKKEASKEDIAIIGLACKFPCADNANEYWYNLCNGLGFIREMPENRTKDIGSSAGKHMKAGWLENIAMFDAGFFRISPKEAVSMHPSQRLFLETVWEAIEDSGYASNEIYRSKTGVYVGIDHTYQMEYNKLDGEQDLLAMTGSMTSVLASRISYILNLRGPNMVVDTACSSGLVATHLACNALKNKECSIAIAGGIHLIRQINDRFEGVQAANGRISAFDKNSQGTVWGEGVGFIVLKPLKQALEDRDNIYAVIKGSAINNDGTTNGITAPSAETQTEVILSAWEDAGIEPETISYIEAHATGTILGDPIEVKGIKTAFEKYTDKKQFCGIGSVKPNIGHCVSAAAISSLVKVILAMKHGQIPQSINFIEPNPFIEFHNSPLYVNDRLRKWETGGLPMRAGISSFGFSRTNCHLILEEAPPVKVDNGQEQENKRPCLFTLSARSESALIEYIKKYDSYINENKDFELKNLCYTVNTGRMHYNYRLAMIVDSKEDFINKIEKLKDMESLSIDDKDILYGEHKIITENMTQDLPGEITKKQKRELDNSLLSKLSGLEILETDAYGNSLRDIAGLYIHGADIQWNKFYKDWRGSKMSLPTYPFERKHYWLKNQKSAERSPGVFLKEIRHPLIDRCLANTLNQEIYLTDLSVDRHWVLTEHLIMDLNVLPGTTYLEIAREAGRKSCGGINVELKDVVLLAPLVVDKNQPKEVHTIIRKENGYMSFTITSRQTGSDAWIVHAEGKMCPNTGTPGAKADLELLKRKCGKYQLPVDMSAPMGGFKFGPRWRNAQAVYVGENEILTELKIQDDFTSDINQFVLHPALLDNAINLAVEKIVQNVEEGLYLPLSVKSLKVYSAMPERFYSYQRIKSKLERGIQTVTLDISLFNEAGEILVEIQGYSIKKASMDALKAASADMHANQYYQTGWICKKISSAEQKLDHKKALILKDQTGRAEKLIEILRSQGKDVLEVSSGSSFQKEAPGKYLVGSDEDSYLKLIGELKDAGVSQIVHMMSIAPDSEVTTMDELEDGKSRGIYSLMYLVRALSENKVSKDIELVLISDNAYEVTKQETVIKPHNASLMALGKVAASEQSKMGLRCIDIDGTTSAEQLAQELGIGEETLLVAYRGGSRYVEEFKECDIQSASREEVEIKDGGVYLITGGTGGIGLEMAKYLAGRNKVNIALVSRSGLPDRDRWDMILEKESDSKLCSVLKTIKDIEKNGSRIICCTGDITSPDHIDTMLKGLRAEFGRINGVIHSAGLAGEGLIIRKDMDRFKKVIAPKMEGTWLLDKFTAEDKPDFFIMFSSMLSIIGAMGQSDYASGNAYMDSFAAYRRRKRGKTATINWTVWNETGMSLKYKIDEVRGPFKSISNAKGIEALDNVLNKDITRLAVGELDFERIIQFGEDIDINLSPDLKAKIERYRVSLRSAANTVEEKKPVNIVAKGKEKVNEIELKVAQVWSEVLALEELSLYDSFSELGGDSIIAAGLLKALDKVFPGIMDMADMFTYPTVKQMAQYIGTKLEQENGQSTAAEETAITSDNEGIIEEIMNRLARGEITEEEADRLIEQNS